MTAANDRPPPIGAPPKRGHARSAAGGTAGCGWLCVAIAVATALCLLEALGPAATAPQPHQARTRPQLARRAAAVSAAIRAPRPEVWQPPPGPPRPRRPAAAGSAAQHRHACRPR